MKIRSIQDETKLSFLAKTIQILSRFYLFPLIVDYRKKVFKLSIFKLHFLIHVVLFSIPFCCYVVWLWYQPNYCHQLFLAFQKVYTNSDLMTMAIFPGYFIFPLATIGVINFQECVALKEEFLKPNITMPKSKLLIPIILFFGLLLIGLFLIYFGNFLALAATNELKEFSYWDNFLNLVLCVYLVFISNLILLVGNFFGVFKSCEIMEEKLNREFRDVEDIKLTMVLFTKFKDAMNLPLLLDLSAS